MPLVAQHQFVAILRERGWKATMVGTWTADGVGIGRGPAGQQARWHVPPQSDDRNEKGTWSSVWLDPEQLEDPDVAMAAEVAGLGDSVLDGPLGPQGRFRLRGLELWVQRAGLTEVARIAPPYLEVAGHRIHLASGAVTAPDGRRRPRDAALEPLPVTDDPGLGRILAEARRLAGL